jgi:phage terminase large subunit GpA-like protein
MHFPIGGAFDAEYFSQLTAEVVRTRYQHGRPYRVWTLPNGKRNEALDTAAYALAARHATRIQILHPRPETKLSARPPEDDDNEMIPPAHPAGEAEGGPEIGLGTQPRRDSDPNMMYQPSRQGQQGASWIYRGERPPGNWINRGRL